MTRTTTTTTTTTGRHALYTSGRFQRNADNADLWELEKSYSDKEPAVTYLHEKVDDSTTAGSPADYSSAGPASRQQPATSKRKRSARISSKSRLEGRKRSSTHANANSVANGNGNGATANGITNGTHGTHGTNGTATPTVTPTVTPAASVHAASNGNSVKATASASVLTQQTPAALHINQVNQNFIHNQILQAHALQQQAHALQQQQQQQQQQKPLVSTAGLVGKEVSTAMGSTVTNFSAQAALEAEETVFPVMLCQHLGVDQRLALLSILLQCDPAVGERFQRALQEDDATAAVTIGGMTKLMLRTFLSSLSVGIGLTLSSAVAGHHAAGAAAVTNADTASSFYNQPQ